jgi:hypothetical protein
MVTLVKEMAVPEVMRAPQIPQYCCFLADSGIRAVAIFPGVLGAWMQVPWLRIAPLATCQRVRTHKIRHASLRCHVAVGPHSVPARNFRMLRISATHISCGGSGMPFQMSERFSPRRIFLRQVEAGKVEPVFHSGPAQLNRQHARAVVYAYIGSSLFTT